MAKMATVLLLLLSLLWSLVEVHSQTEYPYVSFMGKNLANHSYVDLTLVGDDDTDGSYDNVRCHTDLTSCCGGSQGQWYFPNGDEVVANHGDIYRQHDDHRVVIHRTNNAVEPSGIYQCLVPTDAVHYDDHTLV